jgi:hypothetical protein
VAGLRTKKFSRERLSPVLSMRPLLNNIRD